MGSLSITRQAPLSNAVIVGVQVRNKSRPAADTVGPVRKPVVQYEAVLMQWLDELEEQEAEAVLAKLWKQ